MTSVNDLVSGVINRIDGIPSSITGSPMIWEWINDARIDVQNFIGATISQDSISEKYQSILKNLGAAYTLSRLEGVGVDFDYSLGNFKVSKGGSSSNVKQIDFFLSQVNNSLKFIRKIPFKGTFL